MHIFLQLNAPGYLAAVWLPVHIDTLLIYVYTCIYIKAKIRALNRL